MARIHKMILVTALAAVGVWGCSKPASPPAASADTVRSLEGRVAKLETELRSAAADRDAARARAADLERQVREWAAKARAAETARDEAVAKLKAKAAEREQVQAQFDAFRKNIKDLVGRAEGTAQTGTVPLVAGLR